MNTIILVFHITQASIHEQIRRDKYFLTIFALLALVVATVPPPNANHTMVGLGEFRPVYNSAWIGSFVAVFSSIIIALPGFFLIRGSVTKDHWIGLYSVLVTTQIGRIKYLVGKYIANVIVLLNLVIASVLLALLLQFAFGEDSQIQLRQLLIPFLMYTIPSIFLISAISITFEVFPGLSGFFGNIVYLAIWFLLISFAITYSDGHFYPIGQDGRDVFGIGELTSNITSTVKVQHPEYDGRIHVGIVIKDKIYVAQPVQYDGVDLDKQRLMNQLGWIVGSFCFMILSGLMFFRFDPLGQPGKAGTAKASSLEELPQNSRLSMLSKYFLTIHDKRIFKGRENIDKAEGAQKKRKRDREEDVGRIFLLFRALTSPFTSSETRHQYEAMFGNELKELLRHTSFWWFIVMALLIIMCPIVPIEIMHTWVLPVCWIMPLLIWSKLGLRVSKQFRLRSPNIDAQKEYLLMEVLWSLGVIVAIVSGSGAALRFIMEGEWGIMAVWMISAMFIPSLAFVLSMWTTSSFVFEATYILLWLSSMLLERPVLDFMGLDKSSIVMQNPILYLFWTLAIIAFAIVGSQRLIEQRKRLEVKKSYQQTMLR